MIQRRIQFCMFCATLVCLLLVASPASSGVHYRVERILSGLDQPTYLTQAPGDPANIVYFTERAAHDGAGTFGGFGATNNLGKVWKLDVNTRTTSLVVDLNMALPGTVVFNDTGVQGIAFSPDFNTPGTPTYQKMYVSYSQRATGPAGSGAVNNIKEFDITPGGTATLTARGTILQYENNRENNHTVNWIGFDPNATGAARSYLHVSTGDGSFGNVYNDGVSHNNGTTNMGRPSQNPSDLQGKILRIDVNPTLADSYAADSLKNFAIPSSNPIPTYNAANPGSPIMGMVSDVANVKTPAPGLGEVYVTGMRNGYRLSFDRANSDMYWGDVGEVSVEEVSFLKAGTNTGATPPVDYGWPNREGTNDSNISGAPETFTNPFTGVTQLNPIRQFTHSEGLAVIGGYVHRGNITELQGKYFFADFAGVNVGGGQNGKIWMLDFDRNTNPVSFNGANGTLTDVTALLNSLVVDTSDPSYLPSNSSTDIAGLDHIVSFGEDNAGNIYLVDFGNRTIGGTGTQDFFNGQYPREDLGEIFRLTPATINSTWNVNGNGLWSPDANWVGGIPTGSPNGVGDSATFGSVITAPRTVTVDGAKKVSAITFDSLQSYTISGTGPLTLQGQSPALITVNNGTHTIAAPVVFSGDVTIATSTPSSQLLVTWPTPTFTGSNVTKTGPGLVQFVNLRAQSLTATAGTVKISSKVVANDPAGTSVLKGLTIGAAGQFDLTNNSLIIDYTGPVGTLETDTRVHLANNRLTSSSADAAKRLGYGDNAVLGITSFAGQNPDASSMLVKFTYAGDLNLDGQVDITDLGSLATAWQTNGVWTNGDLDYNGFVDITDLGMLATNWQAGVGNPLGPGSLGEALSSLGLPTSAVPEPGLCALLGLAVAFGCGGRRARQRQA